MWLDAKRVPHRLQTKWCQLCLSCYSYPKHSCSTQTNMTGDWWSLSRKTQTFFSKQPFFLGIPVEGMIIPHSLYDVIRFCSVHLVGNIQAYIVALGSHYIRKANQTHFKKCKCMVISEKYWYHLCQVKTFSSVLIVWTLSNRWVAPCYLHTNTHN